MKVLKIITRDLKYLVNVLKFASSKNSTSESALEMIYCTVYNKQLTGITCDGYRFNQVTVPVQVEGDFEDGFLMPLVKVPAKAHSVTHIEFLDNEVVYDFAFEKQTIKTVENDFPVERIKGALPKTEPTTTILVNPKYMKEAFEALSADKNESVTMEIWGELSPIVIRKDENDFALVLPKRKG